MIDPDLLWMLDPDHKDCVGRVNPLLGRIQRLHFDTTLEQRHPLLLVVGPPRAGTTVVSQLLTATLDVGYINNFVARFWMAPALGAMLWRQTRADALPSLRSVRGSTEQIGDPNEFNYFWKRFFAEGPSHACASLPAAKRRSLAWEIAALSTAWNKPVLMKHVFGAVRLIALIRAVPWLRIVVVRRQPLYNAQSLLKVRMDVHGDIGKWWSLRPRQIAALTDMRPCEQVVAQVACIQAEIDRVRAKRPASFVEIRYERYVQDLPRETKRLARELGVRERRGAARAFGSKLGPRQRRIVDRVLFDELRETTARYFDGDAVRPGTIALRSGRAARR